VTDTIRVVRCQSIEGAGSLHHIGAEFLWTAAPGPNALRRFVQKLAGDGYSLLASR
jgi:hypothetical protein